MLCAKCGANLATYAKLCAGCGTRVLTGSSEATATVPRHSKAFKVSLACVICVPLVALGTLVLLAGKSPANTAGVWMLLAGGVPLALVIRWALRNPMDVATIESSNSAPTQRDLVGAFANHRRALSGRQIAGSLSGVIALGAIGGLVFEIGDGHRGSQATEAAGASETPSSDSIPEVCAGKSVSRMTLWNDPSDKVSAISWPPDTDQGRALYELMNNGNYQIEKFIATKGKEDPGKTYCYAKVRISGIYHGNSYDVTMWAMAF